VLRVININVTADSRGKDGQVAFVGADDQITAPEGTFDHAGVGRVTRAAHSSAPAISSGLNGPCSVSY
jgi:hypothetical protein